MSEPVSFFWPPPGTEPPYVKGEMLVPRGAPLAESILRGQMAGWDADIGALCLWRIGLPAVGEANHDLHPDQLPPGTITGDDFGPRPSDRG